jgi:hypothetical protein
MVLPDSYGVSRAPKYLGYRFESRNFRLHGYHILWPSFPAGSASPSIVNSTCAVLQPHSRLLLNGLGCFHFARRYSGNHVCFLFHQVLRWFTSLGALLLSYEFREQSPNLIGRGSPIRKSPDQSLFAAPRGLSQLTTSFIAYLCQGIHHVPLVA